MTDQEQNIERGAAEDASGAPVTQTDLDASRKPPSRSDESAAPGDDSGEATDLPGGSDAS